jgi:hypothetical protein
VSWGNRRGLIDVFQTAVRLQQWMVDASLQRIENRDEMPDRYRCLHVTVSTSLGSVVSEEKIIMLSNQLDKPRKKVC